MQDDAGVERRAHANSAQKFARKVCKIPEIRHAPRTKNCKHSASVRCAYCTASLRLDRVSIAFRSEKSARPASTSRKFCAKIARKVCKIPEIRHASRTKLACIRPACAAHAAQRRCALNERARNTFKSEKASVQCRGHANFAPNSREKIAKLPKNFGAPRARKLRELGQRCFANLRTSLQLFFESV